MTRRVLTITLLLVFANALFSQVTVISSTKYFQWKQSETKAAKTKKAVCDIVIDTTQTYQTIRGWGGSFNEKGWKALRYLSKAEQNKVLAELFGQDGCAFTYCRMPIGASDYALDYYSLNDNWGDYSMSKFSIERDRKYLLPYIKAAMQIQPDLEVWGSPWTPPEWMKENNRYNAGSIKMDAQNLHAYALYFQKYVEAYRNEGVNIVAVHPQNEPLHLPKFPSCGWSGKQLNIFIRDYLGPQFKANVPNCEIWLGTINGNNETDEFNEYINTVFSDSKTAEFITGSGFQWDGDAAVDQTLVTFPEKQIMQTETKCGWGGNDWKYAWETFDQMHWYLERNSVYYQQWNMVLDETGMSSWGWKQNAMITVDTYEKTIRINPQYWIARHYSQYIKPGAVRVACETTEDVKVTAFKNVDSSIVLVLGNNNKETKMLNINLDKKVFKVEISPETINTIIVNN